MYFQQGRGVLRVTPAYVHDRFFIQGQAELVGNLCQTASTTNTVCNTGTFTTDDLWIRVGEWNRWDVKVGRFEGWEVYHLGMGMESYTFERLGAGMFGTVSSDSKYAPNPALEVPSLYAVNYLRDRPTNGLAVGAAALHIYFTDFLRLELLAKLGADNYQANSATGNGQAYTYYGGRLTPIFDMGWFKFKIGAEYQKRVPVMQPVGVKKDPVESLVQKGIGGSVQFVLDPIVECGLNAAIGRQNQLDTMATENPPEDSFTTKSIGGFANVRLFDQLLVGVGINWTTQLDEFLKTGSNANDYTSQLQSFTAFQYLLAGQLYIKAVLGYAHATFQPSDPAIPVWTNSMYSGRIRLMYLY
jgi:hypothetical protein